MERIWYNQKSLNKAINKFLNKYPEYNYDKFLEIAKTAPLKDFRLLCSALQEIDYQNSYFDNVPYEETKALIKACNERINKEIGSDAFETYELFRKTQKHEFWNGDERYQLFGNGFASYSDRQILKSVVIFLQKYKGKPVDLNNIEEISDLLKNGSNWDLYKEPNSINTNWETNDENFKTLNKARQRHVELWITFTNHIWNREYDKAYNIIIVNSNKN